MAFYQAAGEVAAEAGLRSRQHGRSGVQPRAPAYQAASHSSLPELKTDGALFPDSDPRKGGRPSDNRVLCVAAITSAALRYKWTLGGCPSRSAFRYRATPDSSRQPERTRTVGDNRSHEKSR